MVCSWEGVCGAVLQWNLGWCRVCRGNEVKEEVIWDLFHLSRLKEVGPSGAGLGEWL